MSKTVFLVSNNDGVVVKKVKKGSRSDQKGKDKKMSDTAVVNPAIEQESETSEAGVYKGKGNKKVLNPFSGKEEVRNGEFSLPLIQNEDHFKELIPNAEDRIFWANQGRKMQARIQMYSLFDDLFGDETLNETYQSYLLAYSQVVTEKTSEERKAKVRDFILSEDKFADLKVKLEAMNGNFPPVSIDYAVEELKKPSGVRGKKAAKEVPASGE